MTAFQIPVSVLESSAPDIHWQYLPVHNHFLTDSINMPQSAHQITDWFYLSEYTHIFLNIKGYKRHTTSCLCQLQPDILRQKASLNKINLLLAKCQCNSLQNPHPFGCQQSPQKQHILFLHLRKLCKNLLNLP